MSSYNIGSPGSIARKLADDAESGVVYAGAWAVFEYGNGEVITRAVQRTQEAAAKYMRCDDGSLRIMVDVRTHGCKVNECAFLTTGQVRAAADAMRAELEQRRHDVGG